METPVLLARPPCFMNIKLLPCSLEVERRVEQLTEELSTLKAQELRHKEELGRTVSVSETEAREQRQHAAAAAQFAASVQGQLEALTEELAEKDSLLGASSARVAELQVQLASQTKQLEARVAEAAAAHEAASATSAAQLQAAQAALDHARGATEEAMALLAEEQAAVRGLETDAVKLQKEHAAFLSQLETGHAAALSGLEEEHAAVLSKLGEGHSDALSKLKEAAFVLAEEHSAAMSALAKEHSAALSVLAEEHQGVVSDRDQLLDQTSSLQEELQQSRGALRRKTDETVMLQNLTQVGGAEGGRAPCFYLPVKCLLQRLTLLAGLLLTLLPPHLVRCELHTLSQPN